MNSYTVGFFVAMWSILLACGFTLTAAGDRRFRAAPPSLLHSAGSTPIRRAGATLGARRVMTDTEAAALAGHALEYVRPGSAVGLGTGQAATAFVHARARQVQAGLRIVAVPTSEATATLAGQLGIPLTSLDASPSIDVTVDGADEVDPHLDLIKGYGGALLRKKIVAVASRRLVILVGAEKLVPVLGTRGRLPVEVIPFAAGLSPATRGRRSHSGVASSKAPCPSARTTAISSSTARWAPSTIRRGSRRRSGRSREWLAPACP